MPWGKTSRNSSAKKQSDKKTEQICKILAEFCDLKQVAALTGKRANASIVEILRQDGKVCRSKAEIAGVFFAPTQTYRRVPRCLSHIPAFSLDLKNSCQAWQG